MIVSQSVFVEAVAFLMQFSPAGSLQQQNGKLYFDRKEAVLGFTRSICQKICFEK